MVQPEDETPDAPMNDSRGAGKQDGDAHDELERLATTLRRAVLQLAWRQWRALGAGASGRSSGTDAGRLHSVVDPEALVLISLMLVEDERRLADLLHDWTVQNSDLLSVQRVKNLRADYPDSTRAVITHRLAWLATVALDEGKDLRWRSLAADAHGMPDTVDVIWSRSQTLHESETASKKMRATRVRVGQTAALLLRLRLGIGVGLKADVLAYLLAQTQDWASIRDVTDATGYTIAAVRRATEDLAAAQFIESLEGQPTAYRAVDDAWGPLLGLEQRPSWGSWHERFAFSAAFLRWAEEVRHRPLSWYAFGVHGRHLLERYRSAFEHDLIAVWSAHSSIENWAAYVSRSVSALALWMTEMA